MERQQSCHSSINSVGKEPTRKTNCLIKERGRRVEINQPNVIAVYNKTMGRFDRMDQNISAYFINIRHKKWWWHLFQFCVYLAVNNEYQPTAGNR